MDLTHRLSLALAHFAELLERRLHQRVFTTEDAVRYTFFAAINHALELNPHDITLEQPHPTISGARIDTYFTLPEGTKVAAEFKYDRPIPNQSNAPRTQKAGHLLKDLFRLARLESANTLNVFVYLATTEMKTYLQNPSNGLADFFNLVEGGTLRIDDAYLSARATTLRGAAGEAIPWIVQGMLSRKLPEGHELRAYAVRRIP